MAADTVVEIGPRPVPQEPMVSRYLLLHEAQTVDVEGLQYLIANLGMSTNFGHVDLEHLTFPTSMKVDWIRVYQDPNNINYGCDTADFPTQDYINQYVILELFFRVWLSHQCCSLRYIEAYTNPNLTTWQNDYNQPFPKNSFLGQC